MPSSPSNLGLPTLLLLLLALPKDTTRRRCCCTSLAWVTRSAHVFTDTMPHLTPSFSAAAAAHALPIAHLSIQSAALELL